MGARVLLQTARFTVRWRRAVFALGLLMGLGAAAGAARAEEASGWLVNYDLVREVARAGIGDLLTDFPVRQVERVRINVQPPHETAWMVRELLGEQLRQQGVAVVRDTLAGVDVIQVQVVELGLRYTGVTRPHLFGGRQVERLAVASLIGRVDDGAGGLLWTGEGAARRLDEVPESKLPLLEGQAYPFSEPALPPSNAGRIIEPVIVSAIVAGLVFLFVSNSD